MSAILVDVQRIGWTKSATFRPSHDPMQYVASEIKERLLKAIDRDHNVVDMPGVLAVISQLEKASITREDLEQTRLGKYVNEVRKKTSNDSLAKRAKKLVKTWQKLALPQHTAGVNGERAGTTLPAKRSSQPGTPSMSRSASLASLSTQESNADLSGLQTPSTAVSSGRLVGPVSSETLVGAGATNSRVSSPGLHGGRVSPGGSAGSRASSPCARSRTPPASGRAAAPTPKRRRSDTDASPPPTKLHANSVSKRGVETAVAPPNGLLPGTLLGADARYLAAPQECRDDSPPDPGRTRSDAATSEVATPSRGGGGVKLAKVKTTAELIAGLKAHNTPAASMMNSPTMDAIAARRIRDLTHDEEQSRRASVIPDSMRKRKYTRRKAAAAAASSPLLPAASDTDLSKVKTEMVAKFLETSRPPPASAFGSASEPPTRPDSPTLRPLSKVASGVDLSFIYSKLEGREARPGGGGGGQAGPPLPDWVLDHDPDRSNDASATYPKSPVAKSEPLPGRERVTIEEELRAIYGQLSPLREVAGEEEEQQQEEEEGEEAEEVERKPVTEEEVDRICNEQWEGVNGWYDHQGAWKDWNLCFSHPSHAGEFVHVLPYVNIDE
ncbi:PREDICTED: mediator of RNA polymerase II transcription subunit 26-like [Priapulus caudatus]|uniref:Mediator of RNA polymerase II transcription subunit 26 n=1 Tax=Priapulus caudatus TaxID=37621 RepID=A0ABM1EQE9_PRICU|nr:PREDICTED: mediator of RNA polymerase II transcription subunit 26-like [Priapulus caudatus]